MKILYGGKELKISDYYDTLVFSGDKTRRLTVTLEDSGQTVDEVAEMFKDASEGVTVVRDEKQTVYEGFAVADISKNADRTSERVSITFTRG